MKNRGPKYRGYVIEARRARNVLRAMCDPIWVPMPNPVSDNYIQCHNRKYWYEKLVETWPGCVTVDCIDGSTDAVMIHDPKVLGTAVRTTPSIRYPEYRAGCDVTVTLCQNRGYWYVGYWCPYVVQGWGQGRVYINNGEHPDPAWPVRGRTYSA